MSILSFLNISKYYGSDLILDHISFDINKGDKIALIGSNGEGKTTILKLILKEEDVTNNYNENKISEISYLKNIKIGYLNQNLITSLDNTVMQECLLCYKEVFEIEEKMQTVLNQMQENKNNDELLEKYNNLIEYYKEIGGYSYLSDIKNYLARFNFDNSYYDKKVSTLSGGERTKLAFAKLLMFKYDLLLLDEPTNYIDISTIEWLEKFLKSYKGTILFVSHDTYFIENVANKIFELSNHKLEVFNCDYKNYLKLKEERYKYLEKEKEKQDEEITKLRRFIEFYMPKPRFTSRAKDKEKKLNKILENKIEIEKERHKNINLNLQSSNLKNKELLCVKNVVVGYDTPLLKEISFDIYSNDKIAIMGDNGIGKSTLIKTIYGNLKPLHGEILSKRKLNIGYFNQFDLEKEDSKQTILEYLRNNNLNLSDKELRSALGKFYFKGDDINKNLFSTSNGERKRLLLCNLSLKSYDLLLLDEPANHLDLDTKKSLIDSLNKYNGAILFISHDRFFVNQLASKLIYLTKNKNYIIEGNYDDLLIDLEKENSENNIAKENKEQLVEKSTAKPQQNNKLSKNMIVKLQSEVKQIELRLSEINEILTNASYTSYEEVDELVNEKEKLETKYLDLLSKLEESNENG